MLTIRETATFAAWLGKLRDTRARARIARRIDRLALGNPGDVRPIGEGLSELRIDYGPATGSTLSNADRRSSSCFAVATSGLKLGISQRRSGWLLRWRNRDHDDRNACLRFGPVHGRR
jgi:hypothetical protein